MLSASRTTLSSAMASLIKQVAVARPAFLAHPPNYASSPGGRQPTFPQKLSPPPILVNGCPIRRCQQASKPAFHSRSARIRSRKSSWHPRDWGIRRGTLQGPKTSFDSLLLEEPNSIIRPKLGRRHRCTAQAVPAAFQTLASDLPYEAPPLNHPSSSKPDFGPPPPKPPSPYSEWIIEWQTSEMALWLAARGENWLLVEAPMLPREHPTLGRCLFTSRAIQRGETLVEVSRGLIATPRSLPEDLQTALPGDVSDWGRMAVFLVLERRKGGESQWAPYVQAMPPLEKMDSTVFWSDPELALLQGTNLADVTHERRRMMRAEYAALVPVMQSRPDLFDSVPISESEFQHGYALVCSRAWMIEDLDHLSMIPFVDFFNHDGESISHLCYDKEAGLAYVDADRDYEPGEQVLISYGDASNATLALDFGFTLRENPHDTVSVWMPLPANDPLKRRKAELLRSHDFNLQATAAGDPEGGAWFTLKESKSGAAGRGEGIPRRLQALQRVILATSAELDHMEALGRRAGKRFASKGSLTGAREAEALLALLERLEATYDECRAQEVRLAEILAGTRGTESGLEPNYEGVSTGSGEGGAETGSEQDLKVVSRGDGGGCAGFDMDVDAEVLGFHVTNRSVARPSSREAASRPEAPEASEHAPRLLSVESAVVGGRTLSRQRVQMAHDVVKGQARVLRSAVAWLRPRSAGGGLEQFMYGGGDVGLQRR